VKNKARIAKCSAVEAFQFKKGNTSGGKFANNNTKIVIFKKLRSSYPKPAPWY